MEADDPVGLKQDFGPVCAGFEGLVPPSGRAVPAALLQVDADSAPSCCAGKRMRYLRHHGA